MAIGIPCGDDNCFDFPIQRLVGRIGVSRAATTDELLAAQPDRWHPFANFWIRHAGTNSPSLDRILRDDASSRSWFHDDRGNRRGWWTQPRIGSGRPMTV